MLLSSNYRSKFVINLIKTHLSMRIILAKEILSHLRRNFLFQNDLIKCQLNVN